MPKSRLLNEVEMEGRGTPRQQWEAIPEQGRELVLHNVWCSNCSGTVEIVNYRVYSAGRDIVLRGHCKVCSTNVARVVEQD